jgi:anaerobic magnesium-protoporphyrin IX monomethyl ester cyclase
MVELLQAHETGSELGRVRGITFREKGSGPLSGKGKELLSTPDRPMIPDLDALPFPARALLPNASYIRHGKKKEGHSTTTVLSTRGCPFACEFCSNVIFGSSFRERSPEKVVDEIEVALSLGYDRVSFSDDVFTLKRDRLMRICAEIRRRGLHFKWDCLSRVDAMDFDMAREMRAAGCTRIYFGIESGNDGILRLMKKNITANQARQAVESAHQAGLEVGAFFILGYPGDTDDTVLETLRFATSLPIDYLGLTMPYPLPGAALYGRIGRRISREWLPGNGFFGSQSLVFTSDFSRIKMWFGILKGHAQFKIRKKTGKLAPLLLKMVERPTDALFRLLK